MARITKIRVTDTELRRLERSNTKVYLSGVMQKLFRSKWEEHLKKLLTGDRATLDLCAQQLSQNLDFFPLLHTLCLITGKRYDLDAKDHVKAADQWVCWFGENKDRLAWDGDHEIWKTKA
jgi:hypothetical protein